MILKFNMQILIRRNFNTEIYSCDLMVLQMNTLQVNCEDGVDLPMLVVARVKLRYLSQVRNYLSLREGVPCER